MKVKSYAFDMCKWYKERVENETGKTLKCLRSDRGGEFMSTKFTNFCAENGIKHNYLHWGHQNRMLLMKGGILDVLWIMKGN